MKTSFSFFLFFMLCFALHAATPINYTYCNLLGKNSLSDVFKKNSLWYFEEDGVVHVNVEKVSNYVNADDSVSFDTQIPGQFGGLARMKFIIQKDSQKRIKKISKIVYPNMASAGAPIVTSYTDFDYKNNYCVEQEVGSRSGASGAVVTFNVDYCKEWIKLQKKFGKEIDSCIKTMGEFEKLYKTFSEKYTLEGKALFNGVIPEFKGLNVQRAFWDYSCTFDGMGTLSHYKMLEDQNVWNESNLTSKTNEASGAKVTNP